MEWVIGALIVNVLISFLIPLICIMILWVRNPMERKGMIGVALVGIVSYIGMQWGVKEHGLSFLFNHTDLQNFMNVHYVPYLFLVALAGAILALLPILLVTFVFLKRKVSFWETVVWGLAYGATESIFLVGYKSLVTIVEWIKDSSQEISATAGELVLTGYERILMMIIEIAVWMVLIYLIEQKMTIKGALVQIASYTMITFLPGFLIAFSTSGFYDVFDRTTTLWFVYAILTVAAMCSVTVLYAMKDSMTEP